MSKSAKTGIAIVVIIIIIVIAWIWYSHSYRASSTQATQTETPSPVPTQSPVAQVQSNTAGTGLTPTSDHSSAAIEQDSTAVDSQMTGLNSDSANADTGINTMAQ